MALATLLVVACTATASGGEMKATIYDDGRSCPGGCDAHVVIHPHDNGTRFAFLPSSERGAPERCKLSQPCTICFGEPDASCMDIVYRGGGPPAGTFDFTPAFYAENCPKSGIPAALLEACREIDRRIERLGYDRRLNCFAEPTNPHCRETMESAAIAQREDLPKRTLCRDLGLDAFNRSQAADEDKRAHGCDYSFLKLGGPNSKGVRWRRLLPAACRDGTFLGRDGLDCCSNDLRFAASVHPECTPYFPTQP